jgi:hypothetical protein
MTTFDFTIQGCPTYLDYRSRRLQEAQKCGTHQVACILALGLAVREREV